MTFVGCPPSPDLRREAGRLSWSFERLLCCAAALLLCVGCGGYARSMGAARQALSRGDAQRSLEHLNETLEEAPEAYQPLLLLERAVTRHQLGDLEGASEDYQRADEALELLDYTSATAEEVASYLYSDDSAVYRPPAYEKALVNLFNLMSYLERGDVRGAQVEARRFQVYLDYFKDRVRQGEELAAALEPLLTTGVALCAYAFLSGGDLAQAARWAARSPELTELIQSATTDDQDHASLLVLSSSGLIAHKRPVRLGLGRAMLYLSAHPGHGMSAAEHRALQRRALGASVKWVNFVELTQTRRATPQEGQLKGLPGPPLPLSVVNLSQLARADFERDRAKMLTASITRLLARAVVGAGSRRLARRKLGPLGALLLGLAVEGGMSAADTPDTRAWSALPDRLSLYWLKLPPGTYTLSSVSPNSQAITLTLKGGDRGALALPRHPRKESSR